MSAQHPPTYSPSPRIFMCLRVCSVKDTGLIKAECGSTDRHAERKRDRVGRREAGRGRQGPGGNEGVSIYGQSCLQSQISSLQI